MASIKFAHVAEARDGLAGASMRSSAMSICRRVRQHPLELGGCRVGEPGRRPGHGIGQLRPVGVVC